MNTLLVCALMVTAHVQADTFDRTRKLEVRAPFGNDTASFTNSTIPSLPSSTSENTRSPTTIATDDGSSSSSSSKPSDNPPPPPQLPPGNSPPPSPSSGGGKPGHEPPPDNNDACGASVLTYFGSVYPTVYLTVTETFDVTLSAANATMTESETLITPPAACSSTIVAVENSGQVLATIEATIILPGTASSSPGGDSTSFSTMNAPANVTFSGGGRNSVAGGRGPLATPPAPVAPSAPSASNPPKFPAIPVPENGGGEEPEFVNGTPTVVQSTIYAGAPYTSTVIVTKKTPVPVVPRSNEPTLNFGDQPSSVPKPPNSPPAGPGRGGPGRTQSPPTQQPAGPNAVDETNTLVQAPPGGAGNGLIETVIRSLILAPSTTPAIAPQTTLNNVPIAVRSSSIIIGTTTVPIPTDGGAEATITAAGATFTVRPSEIVAATTTVTFGPLSPQGAISIPPTRITAGSGVVVAVAGSTAVVDGTTFRLDASFSTVVTVSGERISIGPSGVALASTTIATAGRVTEAPQIVETVGHVTFTIDGSQVVISGSTFGIGSGAPTVTTEFSGDKVSIGPGGVGFASTTVSPTRVAPATSGDEDDARATGSAADGGDGDDSSAASVSRDPGSAALLSLLAGLVALRVV